MLLPGNSNLAIAHDAARPKITIGGDGDAGDQQSELDGGDGVRLGDGGEIGAEPGAKGLDEHGGERQQQKHDEKEHADGDQDDADGKLLGGDGERARPALSSKRCDGGVGHWPNLCLAQACTRCTNSRMAKEIISIAVPMAAACG